MGKFFAKKEKPFLKAGIFTVIIALCITTMPVFASADSVTGLIFDETSGTITGYTGSATTLIIPSTIDGVAVTGIGDGAFKQCTSLVSVNIPYGVTRIGGYTFFGCTSLTSVVIPEGVTAIENQVFELCISLVSVNIPRGVTSIGDSAFLGCYDLTSVIIPNSVTSIGASAFSSTDLNSVIIPDSVTSIGAGAFEGSDISSIIIPSSVTSIGERAVHSCSNITVKDGNLNYTSNNGVLFNRDMTKLLEYPDKNTKTSYTIPKSVTEIANSAFLGSVYLVSVTIPSSVITLGNASFSNCKSLSSVSIPNSVTFIGASAFSYCENLKSVWLSSSVKGFGSQVFRSCANLADISVDSKNPYFTSVNGILFNKKMTTLIAYPSGNKQASYIVPSSVGAISAYAFDSYYTNLTSVTIPSGVYTIYSPNFDLSTTLCVYANSSAETFAKEYGYKYTVIS